MSLRDDMAEIAAFAIGVVLILLTPFSLVVHVLDLHKFELPKLLLVITLVGGILLAFARHTAKGVGALLQPLRGSHIKLPGGGEIDLPREDNNGA